MENQNSHELEKKFVFLTCMGKKVENKRTEKTKSPFRAFLIFS